MPALARGQASDCSNPELDLFTKVNGVSTDLYSLEFQIFENVTTPGTPIQVFPVTLGQRSTVNVGALCPTGHKLDTGHYVAEYTPDLAEPIGTHEVRWFYKLTSGSTEQQFIEEFEVLAEVVGGASSGYCSVQDLRDEGVPVSVASDTRLQAIIARATRMVDLYTGQWFEPRTLTLTIDGRNSPTIFLGMPIISISSLSVDDLGLLSDEYVVYNRHLTERLVNPDDRENPRVELEQPYEGTILYRHTSGRRLFPRGERNIEIVGVFGYTDYDGSPTGGTPDLICHVTKLIALRELPMMYTDVDDRADAVLAGRVTKLKTRDQEITYAAPTAANMGRQGVGMFTGDPAIDNILMQYRRPIHIGSTGGSGV